MKTRKHSLLSIPARLGLVFVLLTMLVGVAQATTWSQQQQLTASDGTDYDYFGSSVAVDGDTAIVGASGDDVCYYCTDQGSAYVFVRSGATWSEQAHLKTGDNDSHFFGASVAVDGNTALVGAYETSGGGTAYVFVRSGTTWSWEATLTASDAADGDRFGFSVALSGDTAVVGALRDDDMGPNSGSAYVFVKPVGGWEDMTETAKLTASDGAAYDYFGSSVALSGDTAVVGAPVAGNNNQGSAYVFVGSGTTWNQTAELTASDGAASDNFGGSVALSGDTAVVGAPGDDVGSNPGQGSAYVFEKGTGWTGSENQTAKLTAFDAASGDGFGNSVALSGDMAVVGAQNDDVGSNTDQGSAYVFLKPVGGWADTTETGNLTASDGAASDNFGSSVAVSGDTEVVGAGHDDVGSHDDQGSAYVFVPVPPTVDGLDTGDWGMISFIPTIADGFGDASSGFQDITEVFAVYDDTNVYFRVDTLEEPPEQSQVDIYVDNATGGCAQEAGHPDDTDLIYDKRIIAIYSSGWIASMDTCSGGSWIASGATVNFEADYIVEVSVARTDFGSVSPISFFVRYGTSTDFAPDGGDSGTLVELASFTAKSSAGLEASLVWPWLVGVATLIMGGALWVRRRLNTRGNFK